MSFAYDCLVQIVTWKYCFNVSILHYYNNIGYCVIRLNDCSKKNMIDENRNHAFVSRENQDVSITWPPYYVASCEPPRIAKFQQYSSVQARNARVCATIYYCVQYWLLLFRCFTRRKSYMHARWTHIIL